MPQPNWSFEGEKLALIIIDMQNAFCDTKGFMTALGLNIDQCVAAVGPNKRVLEKCRALGVPVFFTRYWLRPDYQDAGLFEALFPGSHQIQAMVGGTWDAEITPELTPLPGEYVVDKQRYSAFYQTNLELALRNLGVTSVVITGVTTNICVESTVRDAFFRDFKVTVVEDCTGAVDDLMQRGAIHTFKYGFADVISSDRFIAKAEAAIPGKVRARVA